MHKQKKRKKIEEQWKMIERKQQFISSLIQSINYISTALQTKQKNKLSAFLLSSL